ncbi:TPA: hypothetical protein ACFRG8_001730 [Neisseria lactamica]|nr:hypothetical protein [Neisseria lactamica]
MKKLSDEEKKWLKKIAQKSDLLKNPTPSGGGSKEQYSKIWSKNKWE